MQEIELLSLLFQRSVAAPNMLDELLDFRVLRIDEGSLKNPRKKSRRPILRLFDWVTARAHGNESG
jgi:hypothetical protein